MRARTAILAVLHRLGLIKLWHCATQGRVPILMFHGVASPKEDGAYEPLRPRLPLQDFRRYIEFLSRCFRFVSLEDAVEMLLGRRRLQPRSLVLTFDDAYRNNATNAWPVLREYEATATFFLPTGYIGTQRAFWVDRLDYAIQHLPEDQQWLKADGMCLRVTGRDRRSLRRLFDTLKRRLLALPWRQAGEVVDAIEALAMAKLSDRPGNDDWAGFMAWEHVRSMQEQGASFGSHTVGHAFLNELPQEDVRAELTDAKAELERRTGIPCVSVAYPNGRFNHGVVRIAKAVGHRIGVTTIENAAKIGDPAMMLPRIGIPRDRISSADLMARVTALSRALSRGRALVRLAERPSTGPRDVGGAR